MSKSFDEFYRAFEDRFRGSPETIKERLAIYRPLLAQLPKKTRRNGIAIDVGCGRGEWLEVVTETGFKSAGVDLNAGMAQVALDKGLTVEVGDAIAFLQMQKSESAVIISAFHVVEHVTTEYLINLLRECHRVLAHGGLLILETPNPENLSVGTWTFYIDPTHEKPLPPILLEFLVQQSGFERTEILRMNGSPVNTGAGALEQTIHTMFELSRDYACLAQKQSEGKEIAEILAPYVASVSQLHPADPSQLKSMVKTVDTEIAEVRAEQAVAHSAELARNAREIAFRDAEIARLHRHIDKMEAEWSAKNTEIGQQLRAMQTSTSWRLTAPLRAMKTGSLVTALWPKTIARVAMERALLWLRHRPRASALVQRSLRIVPPLERRLLAFSRARGGSGLNGEAGWALEPEQECLKEWRRLLDERRSV